MMQIPYFSDMKRLESYLKQFFANRKYRLQLPGPILVGVSGGADSMALVHGLAEIGMEVAVAHVNYGLRPEAWSETEMVQGACLRNGWELHMLQANHATRQPGMSLQHWARDVRYEFFARTAVLGGYTHIATGHHRADRVETLLWSWLRGASPVKLKDLPAHRGQVIRPMIDVPRATIIEYLDRQFIPFAIDSSNQERKYLRNQLRLDVLPALRKVNPSIDDRLLQFAEQLEQQRETLRAMWKDLRTDPVLVRREKGQFWLNSDALMDDSILEQTGGTENGRRLLIDMLLEEGGVREREMEEVTRMWRGQVGTRIELSRGEDVLEVRREKSGIIIRKMARRRKEGELTPVRLEEARADWQSVQMGGRRFEWRRGAAPNSFKSTSAEIDVHWMSTEVIWPLTIRGWEQGDRIQPFGMTGRKLLSDVFAEMGVSRAERERQLVVVDGTGEVILVEGYRIAERVRLPGNARECLEIRLVRL